MTSWRRVMLASLTSGAVLLEVFVPDVDGRQAEVSQGISPKRNYKSPMMVTVTFPGAASTDGWRGAEGRDELRLHLCEGIRIDNAAARIQRSAKGKTIEAEIETRVTLANESHDDKVVDVHLELMHDGGAIAIGKIRKIEVEEEKRTTKSLKWRMGKRVVPDLTQLSLRLTLNVAED